MHRLTPCPILPALPCPVLSFPGVVPDGTRGDLLEEVANLVESPTVLLGAFDAAFLVLPRCGAGAVAGCGVLVRRGMLSVCRDLWWCR